jgi:hypothetical protein
MKVIKVGQSVVNILTTGKKRKLSYMDVDYDPDGWADAKKFFPADFDLMLLKTKEKTYPGWAVGKKWDGLNVKKDIEVLYWKRNN